MQYLLSGTAGWAGLATQNVDGRCVVGDSCVYSSDIYTRTFVREQR